MRFLLSALLLLAGSFAAAAQSVTTAFEGFSGRSNQPVNIEADRLEVREKDEAAIFSGNVVVKQGDSTLRTSKLTIFYVGNAEGKNGQAAQPPIEGKGKDAAGASALPTGRDIRRLEAVGNVIVASQDQRATGDNGIFDMKSNMVTLSGRVVVSQGQNILRGDKLTVDLTSQKSRLDSGGTGRVQGLFVPGAKGR